MRAFRRSALIGLVLLSVPVMVWLLTPQPVLAVRAARSGRLLAALPLAHGETFTLAWTHSVTLRPIRETYRADPDGQLTLMEMRFDQHGPNLPAGPEQGTVWRREGNGWVVTGYDLRLEELNLAVGTLAGHRLEREGAVLSLAPLTGSGALVRLRHEYLPRLVVEVMG